MICLKNEIQMLTNNIIILNQISEIVSKRLNILWFEFELFLNNFLINYYKMKMGASIEYNTRLKNWIMFQL